MNLVRRVGQRLERYFLNRLSSAALERRIARKRGIVFLMYHSIPERSTSYRFACPGSCFQQHCIILDELFEVVSMDQAYQIYSGAEPQATNKPMAVITFDDGFLDNYQVAYPILRRFGFPFLIFLTTDFVEGENQTFMSWDHVVDMAQDRLVTFGAHSNRHINFTALLGPDKEIEVVESGRRIGQKIKQQINYFAYPSGGYDEQSLDLVEDNYRWGFKDRTDGAEDLDPRKIARVSIDSRHRDEKSFLVQLASTEFMVL